MMLSSPSQIRSRIFLGGTFNSKKEPPLNPDDHGLEPAKGQFLVYQAEDGKLKLDVRFEDESVWLTQQLMADLFSKLQAECKSPYQLDL